MFIQQIHSKMLIHLGTKQVTVFMTQCIGHSIALFKDADSVMLIQFF